jgi:hypothetical protein
MGKGAGKTGSRGSSTGAPAAPAPAPAAMTLKQITEHAGQEYNAALARGDIDAAVAWSNVGTHARRELDRGAISSGPRKGETLLDYGRRLRG